MATYNKVIHYIDKKDRSYVVTTLKKNERYGHPNADTRKSNVFRTYVLQWLTRERLHEINQHIARNVFEGILNTLEALHLLNEETIITTEKGWIHMAVIFKTATHMQMAYFATKNLSNDLIIKLYEPIQNNIQYERKKEATKTVGTNT